MMGPALALVLGVAMAQEDAFEAAVEVLEARYPEAVSDGALYRAAISGMAAYVDTLAGTSGSQLLTQAEYARIQAGQQGERQGIGVQFWVVAGRGLVLTQVYPNSPAQQAGLKAGDLVVGVNGRPFTGLSRAAILSLLQGSAGPRVALDVRRHQEGVRTVTVAWGTYWLRPVQPCREEPVPCIEVQHFGAGAANALAAALAERAPASELVLDLRVTEGGMLDEMVRCASLFLDPGEVVVIEQQPGGQGRPHTGSRPRAWTGAITLLVDEGTSGVAEAFAAALREQAQARVVGSRTAGVGTTDSFHPLGGGLVLRLADVGLRSPTGRDWSGEGLAPDLVVEHPDLVLPAPASGAPPDLQLEAAFRLLRAP